jgi:hypothetical protein
MEDWPKGYNVKDLVEIQVIPMIVLQEVMHNGF